MEDGQNWLDPCRALRRTVTAGPACVRRALARWLCTADAIMATPPAAGKSPAAGCGCPGTPAEHARQSSSADGPCRHGAGSAGRQVPLGSTYSEYSLRLSVDGRPRARAGCAPAGSAAGAARHTDCSETVRRAGKARRGSCRPAGAAECDEHARQTGDATHTERSTPVLRRTARVARGMDDQCIHYLAVRGSGAGPTCAGGSAGAVVTPCVLSSIGHRASSIDDNRCSVRSVVGRPADDLCRQCRGCDRRVVAADRWRAACDA